VCQSLIMYIMYIRLTNMSHRVKVRSRQGTRSLEITIPVKISDMMHIERGDLFVLGASENERGETILSYRRVLRSIQERATEEHTAKTITRACSRCHAAMDDKDKYCHICGAPSVS
jgi:hypothetical protein